MTAAVEPLDAVEPTTLAITPVVMAEQIDKHTLREVLNGLRGL